MTFVGKWRITAMDQWAPEDLDLVVPAYLQLDAAGLGEFHFLAVQGELDCRYSERAGRPLVEFSWEGEDEGDSRCGRGWAMLTGDGSLEGHFYFHRGDDSAFTAVRFSEGKKVARTPKPASEARGRRGRASART